MTLGEFLKTVGVGEWNCSTMPADWCLSLGHPDFAARWRDFTDPEACDAVSQGGLVPLWEDGIGAGLPLAEAPYLPGDIGVITAHGLEAGAIFTGERWAIRTGRGFAALHGVTVLKAWRP